MGSDETTQAKKRGRGWREDPLSTFLLVGALVLAVMYGLESRQRSGLDARELQAVAIVERAGLVSTSCTVGAAGGRGEILVVSCEDEPFDRVMTGVAAGLRDSMSDGKGFELVYLGGQGRGGERMQRLCALSDALEIREGSCREVDGRAKDVGQGFVGMFGVK